MNQFRKSLGGALAWAHELKEDTEAWLNSAANRSYLLRRLRNELTGAGYAVEVIQQPAVRSAVHVAVEVGDKATSAMLEYGGDNWTDIVFGVLRQLQGCDEATVFVQLEAREARAFVCCTQPHDGAKRKRVVTLIDVVDADNLVNAYQAAFAHRH